jgi:predicted ribosomally synthesized peptide with SipW-like signal peptide
MKKILISLSVIAAAAAVIIGGTTAFFSDTETSSGNTFTAGAIDLTVANTCYYNGKACINNLWKGTQEACYCSWQFDNLTGKAFFTFNDLKPGDIEKDTIALKVNNNPSWACAKVTINTNEENGCTEPELVDETSCAANSNGELAGKLNFIWWADMNNNGVLDPAEAVSYHYVEGSLADLTSGVGPYFGSTPGTMLLTIADSSLNIFGNTPAPLAGDTTYQIGKAFCFGNLEVNSATGAIECDGEPVDNSTQTDKITATLEFYVVQARNNDQFLCPEHGGI